MAPYSGAVDRPIELSRGYGLNCHFEAGEIRPTARSFM